MSDTEHHYGKVKLVKIEDNLERTCKHILEANGYNIDLTHPDYNHFASYAEYLQDMYDWEKYIVVGDKLYEVTEHTELESWDDISLIEKDSDGTLRFTLRFYNGGGCFSEALENALEEMD